MAVSTVIIKAQAGIKRDGTKFDGDFYTDGQWVRFQRGMPRKIGGYKALSARLSETSRGFTSFSKGDLVYCHSGGAAALKRLTVDRELVCSTVSDRTPSSLIASVNNSWKFDQIYDASTSGNVLIAQVAPNLLNPVNSAGGQLFFGDLMGTAPLTAIALPSGANATGGVIALHPYLAYYGTDGIFGWSVAGEPYELSRPGSGIARIWGQKIIKALPLRSTSGPSCLLWAYDALLRVTFMGGAEVFQFDIIASDISIMSANSVIEVEGVFFWLGVDRFLMFNGVVKELPNQLNLNWFFDNLNQTHKSKIFAFRVPRFGEIWWCYPRGAATECSHALIFNVREGLWYDTALPASFRTSGGHSNFLSSPLLTDASIDHKIWVHENGLDEVSGATTTPISSHFETCDISAVATKGQNSKVRLSAIEPDFIQKGSMTVQVVGRANARAPEVYSTAMTFVETATTQQEQIVFMKEQRRELRVKFTSNVVGGDYQMGQIIGHLETGDSSVLG
jgi:uncharacterized Zn-binding protein involved in type VI secretion